MSTASEGKARFCTSCGQPLAPSAAFCRKCGAGVQPAASPAGEQPAQPLPRQEPPPASAQPPPAARPSPRSKGLGKAVLIAVIAGLLAGGGVAVAVVLLGDDDPSPTQASGPGAAPTVPAGGAAPTETGEADSSSSPADPPTRDRAQMAQEIQSLLLAFHEDVVAERFRDAWSLLSVRKRAKILREDGYPKWAGAKGQASLSPYLSPAGLTVRIDGLEDDGVARVLVTGMGWSEPGSPCTEWSGLTWVKYEGGVWAYDPGYSTTTARRQEWEPRESELLGEGC